MSNDSRRDSSAGTLGSAAVHDPPREQGATPIDDSEWRRAVVTVPEEFVAAIARLHKLTPQKYKKECNRTGEVMLAAVPVYIEDLMAESHTTDLQIEAFQRRVQYLVQQNAHLLGIIEGFGFSYEEENRDSDFAPFWHGFLPGPHRPHVGDGSSRWNDGTYQGGHLRRIANQPDLTGELTGQANAQDVAGAESSGQQSSLTRSELLDLLDGNSMDSKADDMGVVAGKVEENGEEK